MSTASPPRRRPPSHAAAAAPNRRALAEALDRIVRGASEPTAVLAAINDAVALGFGRLAAELTERLSKELAPAQKEALNSAVGSSRSGVEPKAVTRGRLRRNLEALGERADELGDAWDEIRANAELWVEHIVVMRDATGSTIPARIDHDGRIDLKSLADRLRPLGAETPTRESASTRFPPPLLFLGAWPWNVIEEARRRDGDRFNGYRPRIDVVEPRVDAFFASIVASDLMDTIADGRVRLWIGDDAPSRLIDHLIDDPDAPLPERVIELNGEDSAAVFARWNEIEPSRAQYQDRLRSHAIETYAERDASWWRVRFANAGRDGHEPLRVLIPVSRYSTYIRQAGRQLADALNRSGCEARVLTERDTSSIVSPARYLETLCDWTPDLIVQIDHLRHEMDALIPNEIEIPFVCWAQDKLRNIFNEDAGKRIGKLELVIGIGRYELITRYGFPAEQVAPALNVTDPTVFTAERAPNDDHSRFACDIAWVTNHSTPPAALEEELVARFNASERDKTLLEQVSTRIRQIFEGGAEPTLFLSRRELLTNAAPELAHQYSPEALEQVYQYFATPLFDRWYRHQTLDWLIEYAERSGATLKLFGAGWENWPNTAPYAAGSIEPGSDLCVAYQAATVHIHASAFGCLHQRVFDGFAAGGFVLCRLTQNDRLSTLWRIAEKEAARLGREKIGTSDARELAAFLRSEFELGAASLPDRFWHMKRRPSEPDQTTDSCAFLSFDALLEEPGLVSFQSRKRLVDQLNRLRSDDDLRAERTRFVRSRILERLSIDEFASSVISRMTNRLSALGTQ